MLLPSLPGAEIDSTDLAGAEMGHRLVWLVKLNLLGVEAAGGVVAEKIGSTAAHVAADPRELVADSRELIADPRELIANPPKVGVDVFDTEDAASGSPRGGDRQFGPCGG